MPKSPKDIEKKKLVDSIIGNITDYNFDEDEIVSITEQEAEEIEKEYEEALRNGQIKPMDEETDKRLRETVENGRQWIIYSSYMKSQGNKFYDFAEWLNLAEKPVVPQYFIDCFLKG